MTNIRYLYKIQIYLKLLTNFVLANTVKNNMVAYRPCLKAGFLRSNFVNAAKNILSRGIALNRKREAVACALVEEPTSFRCVS